MSTKMTVLAAAMRFLYSVCVIGCFALLSIMPSHALTTYELTATSAEPTLASDFTVNFTDTTNDGSFGPGDTINSFSGVTELFPTDQVYVSIVQIAGGFPPLNGDINGWLFCSTPSSTCDPPGLELGAATIDFTYQLVAVSETPLPAALPLFASGLGALGLLGWRRKRKAAALAAA